MVIGSLIMSDRSRHRLAAVLAAALVAVTVPAAGATPAPATTVPSDLGTAAGAPSSVSRIAGKDRYATAARVAEARKPGVGTVYLASGSDFPDALAAAARAGTTEEPVLLTRTSALPQATTDALTRLRPDTIVVVGGAGAVADSVVRQLRPLTRTGTVTRVAGTDRYETAATVAADYPAGASRVYLASGQGFPDALAVAALAGHQDVPVILTATGHLPPSAAAALQRLQADEVVIVGGAAAVSDAVADQVAQHTGGTVRRVAGEDRYQTAAKVTGEFGGVGPLFLASGQQYPDALVGAALAGRRGLPLMLTPTERLSPATIGAVSARQPDTVRAIGGTASITDATLRSLTELLEDPVGPPDGDIGTTGSLPVGQARYAVPDGAIFVATDGSDDAPGTVRAPLRTVREALDRAGTGDTIVLRGGSYHQRFSVYTTVTIQNYPGEAVWFDGSSPVSGFVREGDRWVVDGWTTEFDSSPTFEWGAPDGTDPGWRFVNPDFPMAAHPDQVWVDGAAQAQVSSLGKVTPGTFYVDYAADRLYLGTNPVGAAVRASTTARAMEIRAKDVTLRGFGVRRYAPSVPHMGTITGESPGLTVENLVITDNATTGIGFFASGAEAHRLTVQRSGLLGIGANTADGFTGTHVLSSDNNTEHFNQAPVSGGLKITRSRGVSLTHSAFVDNEGPGLWTDASVYDTTLGNSVFRDNQGHGISLEISALATVAGNLIQGNGRHGIKINNTSEVSVWNNTLADNGRPINIVQDARRGDNPDDYGHDPRRPFPDPTMPWISKPVTVRNNIIAGTTGNCLLCVEDYSGEFTAEQMQITANGNVYQRDSTAAPSWVAVWARGPKDPAVFRTVAAFRSATGQEHRSLSLDGTEAVQDDGAPTGAVVAAIPGVAVQIPPAVGELLGVPAGTRHLGAFLGGG